MSILPGLDWSVRYGALCDCPVEPIVETLIDPDHPARLFHCVWEALARDPLPHRSELDPRDFPALLKWFMILERLPVAAGKGEQADYRVRLQGTAVAQMMHRELTGCRLSEFCSGEALASRQRVLARAIHEAEPVFARATVTGTNRACVEVSLGFFPFAGAEAGREQVIVVGAPSDRPLRQHL